MQKPCASGNQAEVDNDLCAAPHARSDIPQNHLDSRFPGTDVKQIDVSSAAEQKIQNLRSSGQNEK